VRDDIRFGYNASDDLPASRVLADRIGQRNTKSTLLMALLRAVDVLCRFHGFTIDKALQKGASQACDTDSRPATSCTVGSRSFSTGVG